MKFIRKCPVFLILAVSGLIFTLMGIAGRGSIYKDYKLDLLHRPYLSLVMEGISSKTAPWDIFAGKAGLGSGVQTIAAAVDDGSGQSIEDFESTDENASGIGETAEAAAAENMTGKDETAENPENTGAAPAITYSFETVTEDYFNDAVFIGDSRTVGLFEYGGLEDRADFFAKISLTIYDVFTAQVAKDEETGRMITVEEALSKKQYGKIYLMLGINELGTGNTEYFMKEYRAVIDRLRELQPEAVIFVEGIMRVTATKNEEDPIFNNKNINEKNAEIAKLADNGSIFYIDVNEAVCDENGNLNEEYTIDEVHLKAKYYNIWKQFLLEHGIVR